MPKVDHYALERYVDDELSLFLNDVNTRLQRFMRLNYPVSNTHTDLLKQLIQSNEILLERASQIIRQPNKEAHNPPPEKNNNSEDFFEKK